MPCNSDHMEADSRERELSKVACLLDELDGKNLDRDHWRGYHPAVYNRSVDGDALVSSLCERLQDVCVSDYSLEMQMWWRDHQAADKVRLDRELSDAKHRNEREAALEKLTPYERHLLGIS